MEQLARKRRVGYTVQVIDSHTGGQPTRVVISGGPELGSGSLAERRTLLSDKYDAYRKKCVLEPKCSDAMVGVFLCEPVDARCTTGAIFFNTAGYLGMCVHGTIGLLVTLAYLGRIDIGTHFIETPAGVVKAKLLTRNKVQVENVESYCLHHDVAVDVPSLGTITGRVAWGGNWFFLADDTPYALTTDNISQLTSAGLLVRRALADNNITGTNKAEVDHIEFFQPSDKSGVNSKNFVLCPGGAYDRSPCGTGTSAKVACLADAGLLKPGQTWVQESIIGSCFEATYSHGDSGGVIPTLKGEAYVYGEGQLVHQEGDPFADGIEQ